ncbi:unnamed protein product, partial [Ectocarpus sp. 12 AP-2014]
PLWCPARCRVVSLSIVAFHDVVCLGVIPALCISCARKFECCRHVKKNVGFQTHVFYNTWRVG